MTSIIRKAPVLRLMAVIPIRMKAGMPMGYATSPSKESLSAKKDGFSQGNVNDEENIDQKSTHSQSANAGKNTKKSNSGGPSDAASSRKQNKPSDTGKGNPEGVGMVDQVGSASGSAKRFEEK